jgi:outer membrane lipoprotein LolB
MRRNAGWGPRSAAMVRGTLAAFITAIVLAGCATPQMPGADRSHSGRFSVIATQGDRRETVSGHFNLQVRGSEQVLDLATPLGTTVARIELGPEGARASGPGMQEVRGTDADALGEQLLGWRLPVSGLADWIEGRPVPGRTARVERDGERPNLIEQDGWTIRVQDVFEATRRPRILVLERPATPLAPGVILRLVMDDPAA